MLSVTNTDGPAFRTRSQTHQCLSPATSTSQPDITPEVSEATDPTPKSLTADRLQSLLQMQKTDPLCKRISKHLSNGKVPQHETELFTHVRGLLYKHIIDSSQKFLALVIPKSWKYNIFVEAQDKPGHQGTTHTSCLINANITGRVWIRTSEKTWPTAPFAAEKKPKSRPTLFRWQKFQTDHSTKSP